ncbi:MULTISPECIES: YqhG family protein [Bacillus]|uniref:YqhG family protein n=1 Tax=Bacillus halotolerans TaxID=260554 RepID=A0A9Q4EIX0_9BACI|nr:MULTISPECIES: YqhG family protein [Bacillus]MCM3353770.1 YqhG family protein [Bacillus halotolerans]MCY9184485.1 YqhG family protein [Bacillus halotolerans]MCY9200049.1 YqhG family protein [Bacillus halotolerans]MDY7430741.1 YqhG family protein [Bacillus sp. V26]MEC1646810.1 YqhG family protein [Bacillus halotolerans]
MRQQEVHQFLLRFFQANSCPIIDQGPGYMTVQLTVEMDKQIMNRPFYWHWREKTGGDPNPMKMTFITDKESAPKDLDGEFIYFGAPRLFQIFKAVKQNGRFTRMYEKIESAGAKIPLQPWLGINVMISYQSDMKKDKLLSLGLHLVSGTMIEDFQSKLVQLSLTSQICDYCFTISPMIKPESGLKRMESYITQAAMQEPSDWAEQAVNRWQNDMKLLDQFYEHTEEKPEEYHLEKQALKALYQPKISVQIENGGLFFLQNNISS